MFSRRMLFVWIGTLALTGICMMGCQQRIVFVTESASTGDLGGMAGADAICQTEANAAGLSGTFLAWISDRTSSPSMRFNHAPEAAYVLVDGTIVALNWDDLTDEMLIRPINLNALGTRFPQVGVWTSTNPDGTRIEEDHFCQDWTSSQLDDNGVVGGSGNTDLSWSIALGLGCHFDLAHLYCFEQ